ncbi:MAG TPA: endolytic transglycosylase MltG [Mycobacteriales bacterium]|nr:endolytic transglycosylase MltG [Mycobacteriales bacterium]
MSDLWILGIGDDEEEAPQPARRHRRKQRRRRGPLGGLLAIVVILGLVAGIFYGGRAVLDTVGATPDYAGQGQGSVTIEVKDGDTARDIAVTLVKSGVIKSEKAFNDTARDDVRALSIQPGFYTLRRHMSGANAFALILDPASRSGRVTVPEGETVADTLALLAKKSGVSLADLQAAAKDGPALGLPGYARGHSEGFLYPTTYDFPKGGKARDMLRKMVSAFGENVDQATLTQGARALRRTPYDVLIVASLVEKEGITDDFPKIARVLYNRLDQGMNLQLDSTVNYALHRNNIKVTQAQIDAAAHSPYNTYQRAGLPPTPISNPGLDAVNAALHPAAGQWLYFVKASKDGHSAFAVTLAEHDANVARARAAGVF